MIGWMSIFALMMLLVMLPTGATHSLDPVFVTITRAVFGILLLLSALTLVLRSRA
jgi:hypothetical protein